MDVLTHLQDNYSQLIPHRLLEHKDIINKTIYNPLDLVATVFSDVDKLFEFSNITRTSYTQDQAVNIAYGILHMTRKFGLAIYEWNYMTTVQRNWVRFRQFFWTEH